MRGARQRRARVNPIWPEGHPNPDRAKRVPVYRTGRQYGVLPAPNHQGGGEDLITVSKVKGRMGGHTGGWGWSRRCLAAGPGGGVGGELSVEAGTAFVPPLPQGGGGVQPVRQALAHHRNVHSNYPIRKQYNNVHGFQPPTSQHQPIEVVEVTTQRPSTPDHSLYRRLVVCTPC